MGQNGLHTVVIIGGGLGGLSAGAMLSKEGFDVTVLEQGAQIGGCLQCFERDGVKFETGMHIVGSVGKGEILSNYLELFGIKEKLRFSKLNEEAYDVVSIGGERFPFANGREKMSESFLERFPSQGEALKQYWQMVDAVASVAPYYGGEREKGYSIESKSGLPNSLYQSLLTCSLNEKLNELIDDSLLRAVLVGNMPLYAGVKDKTPFALHAFIRDFYNRGTYRVVGGSDNIAKALREVIVENGGRILTNRMVTKIRCENGRVRFVTDREERNYEGDIFISDIHPARMVDLVDEGAFRNSYSDRIKSLQNTTSVFSLFIKFKENQVPYINSNFFCYRRGNPWTLGEYTDESWPVGYLYMHHCHEQEPRFAKSGVMLSYMEAGELERWTNTSLMCRGNGYEAFKHKKALQMLVALEEEFPGIGDKIESYYTATPLTYRDYTCTPDGSMYGIMPDVTKGFTSRVSYRTKLPNLLLVGQNINSHGILGVLIGSMNVCKTLLEQRDKQVCKTCIPVQKNIDKPSHNVVILGGGLGGLFTGALLAKAGKKVTVIEKNRILGGGLQTFVRGGVRFPTGMHVFGGMQVGGVLRGICDYLGITEEISAVPTDEDCFDEIFGIEVNGKSIRLPRGRKRYTEYLISLFPHEREGIEAYVDAIYRLYDEEMSALKNTSMELPSFSDDFLWPADVFVGHFIHDNQLKALLSYLVPLYAGKKGETPAYEHAMVNVLHIEGSYMFRNGSQCMADALANVIRGAGGEIITGEEVVSLNVEDRRVVDLQTSSGQHYTAEHYISDIDPRRLVAISSAGAFPPSFRNRINEAPYSYSAFKVYIKFKTETVRHYAHPLYFMAKTHGTLSSSMPNNAWDAAPVGREEWPRCMMAVTEPDSENSVFASSMTVLSPAPYEWFEQWADSHTGRRPEAYYKLKSELQSIVVDSLSHFDVAISDGIESVYSSSPLTIRDFYGVPYGAMYGFHNDCNHPMETRLSVNTKVKNLFLTGQNVNLHGMCGVAITSLFTVEKVLGIKIIL